jgi:hypothetical protein
MLDPGPLVRHPRHRAVSLLLLTASVCLGLVTMTRLQSAGWPRWTLAVDVVCAAAVMLALAWRILPRDTMTPAGVIRLASGNGG